MKIIVPIVLLMLLLSSCGSINIQKEDYHIFDYNNQTNFYYNNGEMYADNIGRLSYVDFDSMNTTYICPKPNCPHTDSEICSSYGMSILTIAIDDRIYYFNPNPHYDRNGEFIEETEVYSASIDGTGRIKEGIIDGQSIIGGYAIYGDGKLYFGDTRKLDNGKSELYIRSYDYQSKSVSEYGSMLESYAVDVKFCGESNGEIYLMLSYQTEEIIWGEDTEIDYEYVKSISHFDYKKLNTETGEVSVWSIPESISSANNMDVYALVKDGYIVYSDSKDTLVVTPEGGEYFFNGYDACNISILNGMVIPYLNSGENRAIDLKHGKLVTVNLKEENISWAYVCGYHEEKYVLRYIDPVKWYEYKKVDLEVIE